MILRVFLWVVTMGILLVVEKVYVMDGEKADTMAGSMVGSTARC